MQGRTKILHVVGSLNQTQQLYQIAREMPECDHYFTQFFGEGAVWKWMAEGGILDWTILGTGSAFRREQSDFLDQTGVRYDYRGSFYRDEYAVVFLCTDIMVPKRFSNAKLVFVQEGMTDPLNAQAKIIHKLGLPRWLAGNTALNGCSNQCDLYFAASEGYARYFESMGTDPSKIHVTGIPNFDHAESFLTNDFPHRDYVLVCTSDIREVGGKENRIAFLKNCKRIAEGRRIMVKLHPNEKTDRARDEVKRVFGEDALVLQKGNTGHMIANCAELITQYSSVVYIGMALEKRVHSLFPMDLLKERMPVQNGGTSAARIAERVRALLKRVEPSCFPETVSSFRRATAS
ncbi:MAG: hypothetical protein KBF37_11210 [Saprospiraceae bacterium]|jgi:hypothetical protein|nr:hypothetical protein [Saprospiraceae bacterium]